MSTPVTKELIHSAMLAELMQASAYQLADMAKVSRTGGGAGDRFLLNVRDAWAAELVADNGTPLARDEAEDTWMQIADDAPSVYTTRKWEQFTDLRAWEEDLSDWDIKSMDTMASVALYQIADRLLQALHDELAGDPDIEARVEFYDELLTRGWEIVIPDMDLIDTYAIVNKDDTVMAYFTGEKFFEAPLDILVLIPTN